MSPAPASVSTAHLRQTRATPRAFSPQRVHAPAALPTQTTTDTPALRLTGQTPVVGPDGTFDIRADFIDPTPSAGLDVALAIYQRVTDRPALLDSINGVRLGSPISLNVRPLALDTGTPLSSGSTATPTPTSPPTLTASPPATRLVSQRVTIGTCDTCVSIPTDGVYPLSLDVRTHADGTVISRIITHLIVQRGAGTTLSVALLVPATLPRTLMADGSTRIIPLTHLVAAAESLASKRDVPLSIVPTPAIVGNAGADVAIGGAVDTLANGLDGREVIATPYESIHSQVQQDGRLSEVVQGQWRRGADTLSARFGESVVSDTWVVGPSDEIPDRDGMVKLGPQRLVVHSTHVAEATGDTGGAMTTLLDRPVVFDTGLTFNRQSDGSLVQGETLEESSAITAVVTDETMTAHLRDSESILGVNHLLADLAVASERADGDAAIAVWVPDEAVRRSTLDALLSGVSALKSVRAVRATELFDRPMGTDASGGLRSIGRIAQAEIDISDDYFSLIDTARRSIDGVNLMLASSAATQAPANDAERFFSAALANPDAGSVSAVRTGAEQAGRPYLNVAAQLADRTLAGVQLSRGGPFRLTALRGRIPVTVENLTGGPVTVHLSVVQGRVRSTASSAEQDVVVESGSQVVLLDVETRSSGSFDVQVALTTPNGVALSQRSYTIRSTGVSGIGVTLTLTLLGLLILWWLSNRMKHGSSRPRRRRATTGTQPDTTPPDHTRSSVPAADGNRPA